MQASSSTSDKEKAIPAVYIDQPANTPTHLSGNEDDHELIIGELQKIPLYWEVTGAEIDECEKKLINIEEGDAKTDEVNAIIKRLDDLLKESKKHKDLYPGNFFLVVFHLLLIFNASGNYKKAAGCADIIKENIFTLQDEQLTFYHRELKPDPNDNQLLESSIYSYSLTTEYINFLKYLCRNQCYQVLVNTANALRRKNPSPPDNKIKEFLTEAEKDLYVLIEEAGVKTRLSVLYNRMGNLKRALHDFGGALENYHYAISSDDQYSKAYSNLGGLLSVMGCDEQAIVACTTATKLDSKNPFHWRQLGYAQQRAGDIAAAIAAFDRAISLCNGDNSPYKETFTIDKINIECLLQNLADEDYKTKITTVKTLLKKEPGNQSYLICLSTIYICSKRYLDAIDLAKNNSAYGGLHGLINLSTAYIKTFNYCGALTTLETFASQVVENKTNLVAREEHLCRSYTHLGRIALDYQLWQQAIDFYTKAIDYCKDIAEKENLNKYLTEAENGMEAFKKKKEGKIKDGRVTVDGQNMFFHSARTDVRYENTVCFELELLGETDQKKWYEKNLFTIRRSRDYKSIKKIDKSKAGEKKLATTKGNRLYPFIVTSKKEIFVGDSGGHCELFTVLLDESVIEEKGVAYAGCIIYKEGKIELWNNCSGHFEPFTQTAGHISETTGLPFGKFYSRESIIDNLIKLDVMFDGNEKKIAEAYGFSTKGCITELFATTFSPDQASVLRPRRKQNKQMAEALKNAKEFRKEGDTAKKEGKGGQAVNHYNAAKAKLTVFLETIERLIDKEERKSKPNQELLALLREFEQNEEVNNLLADLEKNIACLNQDTTQGIKAPRHGP